MFIEHSEFNFLNIIINNIDIISEEFEAASKTEFLSAFLNEKNPTIYNHVEYWIRDNKFHPDNIGYEVRDGVWASFPLYKIGFPINWYNPKEYFPRTLALLKATPALNYASFMRLDAGSLVTPHKHLMKNYIFHVLINDLDGECEFSVENSRKSLKKKGDALLFDYSKEHSSVNKSSKSRITFTVDFDPYLLSI